MKQRVDEFSLAKSKMASDFKAVITDSEDLLKAAAAATGDSFAAAHAKFEEKLRSVRAGLADASRAAVGTARETAAAADGYVHGNPWTAIGIAAAAGILIGFLAARR